MRHDLKHLVKKRQQYSKTRTDQTSPTSADITKAKYPTTDTTNNKKVTTRGTTTRDTNKGIMRNRTCKKAEKI